MANLTIRNIPEDLMEKLRRQSKAEKRSLNNEILMVLEKCVDLYTVEKIDDIFLKEAQAELWEKIAGEWDDERSAAEISADIRAHRTTGRKVDL